MTKYDIAKKFQFEGEVDGITPYGEGHINDTFLVTIKNSSERYVLQRLNTKIFTNYRGLMENIQKVTAVLRDIVQAQGGDVDRECMQLVPTIDGKAYYVNGTDCWRVYLFVKDTVVYQVIDSPAVFENTGEAFGKFIARLDGFDANTLCEVIPNFHNTVDRYNKFLTAIEQNKSNRAHLVKTEIDFVKKRADKLSLIVDALESRQIPLRVTHNDTKINNVLIDKTTGKAICVIDLDTIMPGSLLYDFGDSIRSGCNTALEDEKDLSIV
ncbi:MAG: aminoglycoside phosphotransferase family protein, partial [Clostridia bacterium]|nr:aminoglycoside phosphotransferase family protein [Clostridia bacterium]